MGQQTAAIEESLVKLEAGVACIEWCLPRLIKAYQIAAANNLPLPAISHRQLELVASMSETLANALDNL